MLIQRLNYSGQHLKKKKKKMQLMQLMNTILTHL